MSQFINQHKFAADDNEFSSLIKQAQLKKLQNEIESEKKIQRIPEPTEFQKVDAELQARLRAHRIPGYL